MLRRSHAAGGYPWCVSFRCLNSGIDRLIQPGTHRFSCSSGESCSSSIPSYNIVYLKSQLHSRKTDVQILQAPALLWTAESVLRICPFRFPLRWARRCRSLRVCSFNRRYKAGLLKGSGAETAQDLPEIFDCIILVSYRQRKSPDPRGRMSHSNRPQTRF